MRQAAEGEGLRSRAPWDDWETGLEQRVGCLLESPRRELRLQSRGGVHSELAAERLEGV